MRALAFITFGLFRAALITGVCVVLAGAAAVLAGAVFVLAVLAAVAARDGAANTDAASSAAEMVFSMVGPPSGDRRGWRPMSLRRSCCEASGCALNPR